MKRKSTKIAVSANEDIDDLIRNIDEEIEEIIHPGTKLHLEQEQANKKLHLEQEQANKLIEEQSKVKKAQVDKLLEDQSKPKNYSGDESGEKQSTPGDQPIGLPSKVEEKEKDEEEDYDDEDDDKEAEERDEASKLARKKEEDAIKLQEQIVADNISKIFTTLSTQIEEFKLRSKEATDKLWSEEDRNAELEGKIEILEEEKLSLLEAKARSIEAAANGRIFRPVQDVKFVNTASKNLRGEEIRRALLFDDYEESGPMDELYSSGAGGFLMALLKIFIKNMTPFRRDIKKVNAQFGSSVASYFIFYRFIFLQSMFIAAVAAIFTGFHISNMVKKGGTFTTIVKSNHILPHFMKFSSFNPDEALIYSTIIIIGILVSFTVILYKYLSEDMMSKEAISVERENSYTYANSCFCAWDNSIGSNVEAYDHSGSLIQLHALLLSETQATNVKDLRSSIDMSYIYARRVIGSFLYLLVQAIAFFLIIFVTYYNKTITNSLSNLPIPGLANLGAIVSPAVLTAINTMTPTLFTKITLLEQWDNAAIEVEILLFRLFISSTLNLLLLSFSYALLASPFLLGDQKTIRLGLAIEYSNAYTCRMDQVANGLFTLVVFSFVIKIATMFMIPFAQQYKAKYDNKPFIKEEFRIAVRIVETLHLISVVALSFPFAPLTIVFLPIFLFITFKWEKYTILKFYSKPKRPWKAHKAGTVFTLFYLFSLILIGIPSAIFFLATPSFPKRCNIQDENVNLCLGAVDSVTNICTTNPLSEFYDLYGGAGSKGLQSKYPNDICKGSEACGAFADIDGANITVLWQAILKIEVLQIIVDILFFYPYFPWVLALLLWVIFIQNSNSIIVNLAYSCHKERSLNARIQVLESEIKKQAKITGRMRSIARVSDDTKTSQPHNYSNKPSNKLSQKLDLSTKMKPLIKKL